MHNVRGVAAIVSGRKVAAWLCTNQHVQDGYNISNHLKVHSGLSFLISRRYFSQQELSTRQCRPSRSYHSSTSPINSRRDNCKAFSGMVQDFSKLTPTTIRDGKAFHSLQTQATRAQPQVKFPAISSTSCESSSHPSFHSARASSIQQYRPFQLRPSPARPPPRPSRVQSPTSHERKLPPLLGVQGRLELQLITRYKAS